MDDETKPSTTMDLDDDLIKSDEEFEDSSTEEEMSDENDIEDEDMDGAAQSGSSKSSKSSQGKKIYIPGAAGQKLPKGTVLVPDESAYVMRHEFGTDSFPAYSFDYIGTGNLGRKLGENRQTWIFFKNPVYASLKHIIHMSHPWAKLWIPSLIKRVLLILPSPLLSHNNPPWHSQPRLPHDHPHRRRHLRRPQQ